MQELVILTDIPITRESCADLIIKNIKSLPLLNNDEITLYMKKNKRGFEMWFSPEDVLDDPMCMMDNTVDRCPNKKAYLTNLKYTSKSIASKVVSILKPLYGNMWIQSDEDDDWFGTADEFIEDYCKH